MKKLLLMVVALLALAAPAAYAAEHGGHMPGMTHSGSAAHEEVVNGVKATFTVQTMKEAMKAMGMEMPAGVKDTHHISVSFIDVKSGKTISSGEVMVKVQAPDKTTQTKEMMGMHGHFGADFTLAKKGKYGVMCKFKLQDGKERSSKFWYEIK
ncbi:MAG TPA: hypothetical protein VFF53_00065 [Geobacteraceae bacterium]|nr:hypothetical protein [Geobacteraceae bacterium]